MIIVNTDTPREDLKYPPVPEKPSKEGARPPQAEAPLPPPPPYSPPPGPSCVPLGPSLPRTPTSVFQPQNPQTVNHFELFSKHGAISGTYLIDPLMPSPIAGLSKKMMHKREKVWGKGPKKEELNASFRTRHGALSLDMAVVSKSDPLYPPQQKVPARILVSSRHGRVHLDMHEVHPGSNLDLHVESRNGKVTLLLPPTFNGPVVIQTRHGKVSLLPGFAARARTLRASDEETLVLCTPPDAAPAPEPVLADKKSLSGTDGGDRALVRTRHARITVGISGLDAEEEPRGGRGLFETLGRFMEVQGRAIGQYVEERARGLERSLTERGEAFTQYLDAQIEKGKAPPRVVGGAGYVYAPRGQGCGASSAAQCPPR